MDALLYSTDKRTIKQFISWKVVATVFFGGGDACGIILIDYIEKNVYKKANFFLIKKNPLKNQ